MSRFKPIKSLKPKYGFVCVLRGLESSGAKTYCVAKWTQNGRSFYKAHSLNFWTVKDDWCLLETGSYAEDDEVLFKPTHWGELPKEPDE